MSTSTFELMFEFYHGWGPNRGRRHHLWTPIRTAAARARLGAGFTGAPIGLAAQAPEREQVLGDVLAWLEQRLPSAA